MLPNSQVKLLAPNRFTSFDVYRTNLIATLDQIQLNYHVFLVLLSVLILGNIGFTTSVNPKVCKDNKTQNGFIHFFIKSFYSLFISCKD